jgi:hypothetical protein
MGSRASLDIKENINVSCPCREWNPGHPNRSLVAIPVELSRPVYSKLTIMEHKSFPVCSHLSNVFEPLLEMGLKEIVRNVRRDFIWLRTAIIL